MGLTGFFSQLLLPRPRLQYERAGQLVKPVKRIIVIGRFPNPTCDYYLAARLRAPGMPVFEFADIRRLRSGDIDPDGTFILVCRYISLEAVRWVERHKSRLSGVGLFVDDDIAAVIIGQDANLAYRLFLWFRAILPLARLNQQLDMLWVSTPHLARAIAEPRARILPPSPPERLWKTKAYLRQPSQAKYLVIAYHATAVHVEEHHFLRPIITAVLARHSHVRFDVFAGPKAEVIWRGMDRVRIRKPVSWSEYLANAEEMNVDVMLVPLLRSSVNDCRAPTKRIDVARFRAAGIFSASPAYGNPTDNGEIRLPNEHEAWVNAILALIDDDNLRAAKAEETRLLVAEMAELARSGLGMEFTS